MPTTVPQGRFHYILTRGWFGRWCVYISNPVLGKPYWVATFLLKGDAENFVKMKEA